MSHAERRPEIGNLCDEFLAGLCRSVGEKLIGVYIYGAVTFPETRHTGDVDFHVILSRPPTGGERTALLALHERLAADFPPLGAELDGYYILEREARGAVPPQHLLFPHLRDDSFALHRAHILAGRVWVLFGPDPATIYATPAWDELAAALDGELRYVTDHLTQYPAYCVLNLCRLLYSWETRDVVTSKAAAAVWARGRVPEWTRWIDLATASYAGTLTPDAEAELVDGVRGLYTDALRKISTLGGGSG